MRGRIVLFVVLAVVIALVGVYAGRSTNTPKAVGEPSTATPSDSSVGSTQRRAPRSAPSRSPTASSQKAGSPKSPVKPVDTATTSGHKPGTLPASQPQPRTDPVRFGKVTTKPSNNTTTLDVSSDGRALTTVFSDREVQVGNGEVTEGDATRSFAMTLPLTDGAKGETLWVHAQGYALADEGASARLTLRLNGQVKVEDFPAGWDDDFLRTLQLPATPATTYQLSGVIEVHQDPGTNGTAYLDVLSIDAEIR
jgi:hypothetical protein